MPPSLSARPSTVPTPAPTPKRAVLTIVAHSPQPLPALPPASQPSQEFQESQCVPAGWKTCHVCHGSRVKTGLWACYGGLHGTRRCDMCDGQGILPESEADSSAHYGYPEERQNYED